MVRVKALLFNYLISLIQNLPSQTWNNFNKMNKQQPQNCWKMRVIYLARKFSFLK